MHNFVQIESEWGVFVKLYENGRGEEEGGGRGLGLDGLQLLKDGWDLMMFAMAYTMY